MPKNSPPPPSPSQTPQTTNDTPTNNITPDAFTATTPPNTGPTHSPEATTQTDRERAPNSPSLTLPRRKSDKRRLSPNKNYKKSPNSKDDSTTSRWSTRTTPPSGDSRYVHPAKGRSPIEDANQPTSPFLRTNTDRSGEETTGIPYQDPRPTEDDPTPFPNPPTMVAIPKVFTGNHEDIERFIGDCLMYFEAHASYFVLPSHMIPFASSLFDGAAKTWWVHKRLEYWAGTGPAPHRFRYPTWEGFINDVNDQFRDPAAMEVQEKKMFDLRMGNGPATAYFQELEVLATKAGR
ncbi:uncharacterized protein ARMOST_18686 [Armillaria ostoyae]|uniref:Retrotransposon gag domain-containing protein n=1 Tax=Armillaria ostoyae TaxID=47428 RepID=A0A284S2G4_ARMOS|nr:uncharacterized protein ARMOST_18686 [Armillaria ostoyae]